MVEGDYRPYQEDKVTHYALAGLGPEKGSWWGRICHEAFELMKRRGSSIHGSDEVEKGLHHPQITATKQDTVFVPLGPWATDPSPEKAISLAEQGILMSENAREFANALSLLFEEAGYKPEVVAEWLHGVNADLDSEGGNHEYVKYRYTWGVKKPSED